ncbi:MAG: hypothetical protein O3C21_03790 [Verrucomicrobia bacterium]|nr:hypothetical protein [Verrucomicrobiota bacterium]
MSYYEFYKEGSMERRTDLEWQEILRFQPPPPESWTQDYLVP